MNIPDWFFQLFRNEGPARIQTVSCGFEIFADGIVFHWQGENLDEAVMGFLESYIKCRKEMEK